MRFLQQAKVLFYGPSGIAFVPALCLAAFWFGGEVSLMIAAVVLPLVNMVSGGLDRASLLPGETVSGFIDHSVFDDLVDGIYRKSVDTGLHAAVFAVAIDEFESLTERHGPAAADIIMRGTGDRLVTALRGGDHIGFLSAGRFAICTSPVRQLDLETCIQMAGRLQSAIEDPISIDGLAVYVSASVGFCQSSRAPGTSSADWLDGAKIALEEARQRGPFAIRAFSDQMHQNAKNRVAMQEEVGQALDNGQIIPWFQPQISTDTGEISGFEALARWSHPLRGMIAPSDFLPAIERAGLLERLAEVMMYHSFAALKAWDAADVDVPRVGVNFAGPELSNPRLLEKIQWELDRFDLTPDRLAVEVLETVVASAPDDMITRNINALGQLGCRIDLDDFGTGHASISSIRRFSVSRIKIDRSFVMKADRDADQQRMISAILTMAERLGVETLAEGVESVGEHVLLAQLGCDHVQGYGIARPMPFEQTLEWIARHNAKLDDAPRMLDGRTK
ncbi:MAG: GGDEF domain-containing phosphodiesterase [Sulfitobacter sp.]